MSTEALISTQEREATRAAARAWSLPLCIGFRFIFCCLVLCCLPSSGQVWLLDTIPLLKSLGIPWIWLTHKVTPWVAIHLFHLQGKRVTYFPTGSGDTTLDSVQFCVYLVMALIATLIWSVLDRRRVRYDGLHAWLRVLVRLTLAVTLLSYGIAKIIPTQFQSPRLTQLTETYGESSPMGLLWTFMGSSIPYVIFSGLAEARWTSSVADAVFPALPNQNDIQTQMKTVLAPTDAKRPKCAGDYRSFKTRSSED